MADYQHIIGKQIHGVFVVRVITPKLHTPDVAKQLQAELTTAIEAEDAKTVTVDFGNVTFVSSVCLLSFLAVRRLSGVEKIVFCNLSPMLRSVFDACGLIHADECHAAVFEDAGTLDQAIARGQQERPD